MTILVDGEWKILLDCGPQVVYQLRKLNMKSSQLNYVAPTHYHGDHAAGLPLLLLDLVYHEKCLVEFVANRNDYDNMLKMYHTYFGEAPLENCIRLHPFDEPFPFEFHRMANRHTFPGHIFKVTLDGKSIVYTGDTSPVDMSQFARGADLIIHEASAIDETVAEQYGHSTAWQAAEAAHSAGAKRLALIHRPSHDDENVKRARSIFPECVLPNDLETLEL
jgi:ribonuclease BN (tRNA processing enzyme)